VSPATAREVLASLHELYPDADVELAWKTPLDLVVATILSAQSTDERVNRVTTDLFRRYRTAADYVAADPAAFEREIHSTGFFRQKTKAVLGAARRIVDDFGGEVPRTLEELVTLPGVARKTANLVLGTAFGEAAGVVVDTHVRRGAYRLGLTLETAPEKVERDLMAVLPREEWIFAGHALILHGRRVCAARKPRCSRCGLAPWCPRNGVVAAA
jgi:endonuclease-3